MRAAKRQALLNVQELLTPTIIPKLPKKMTYTRSFSCDAQFYFDLLRSVDKASRLRIKENKKNGYSQLTVFNPMGDSKTVCCECVDLGMT